MANKLVRGPMQEFNAEAHVGLVSCWEKAKLGERVTEGWGSHGWLSHAWPEATWYWDLQARCCGWGNQKWWSREQAQSCTWSRWARGQDFIKIGAHDWGTCCNLGRDMLCERLFLAMAARTHKNMDTFGTHGDMVRDGKGSRLMFMWMCWSVIGWL